MQILTRGFFAAPHLGTFALQNLRRLPGLADQATCLSYRQVAAWSDHVYMIPCKRDQIKMSGYMDRRVTPPERVTQLSHVNMPLGVF